MDRYRGWYWYIILSFLGTIVSLNAIGHNIELMNQHMPIMESFDAVYLVDLCEPLLDIARKRFAKKGWTNVTVLCQDANEFRLPEWANGKDPKGSVGFVTLSYSLSMASNIVAVSLPIELIVTRFPVFILPWTELIMYCAPRMGFLQSSIFILRVNNHPCTKRRSAGSARNVDGCPDGSGRYGLTLIM